MASALQHLSEFDASTLPDPQGFQLGIVVSDWNQDITHALYEGCYQTLVEQGVTTQNIHTIQVPGSFELPMGAQLLANKHNVDAIICLGCVIKGETRHDEYINHAVATGLTHLSLAMGKPVIFGVLTPDNIEQAQDRSGGKHGNKGVEAAVTALRMIGLAQELKGGKHHIGFSK